MSKMHGPDVSSNNPENILSKIDYDFAIVKAGGNPHGYKWDYVNPYAKQQMKDAYKKCGLVGMYWFCYGKSNANVEADKFVSVVKSLGYLGKCILVVDYEADALAKGRAWVKKFCQRVEKKAGYAPVIYSSGSVIKSQKLESLGYPLWCANYSKGSNRIDGYDTSGCTKMVKSAVLWQFTDHGYLKGYSGRLDLNEFYGSRADWLKLAGRKQATEESKKASSAKSVQYIVTASRLNVRSRRSTLTGKVVATLKRGAKVKLKNVKKNSAGNTWAEIAEGKHKGKFIAVKFKGEQLARKV